MSNEAVKAYDEFEAAILGRGPAEIRRQAENLLDNAIKGAVFASSTAGSSAPVLPLSAPLKKENNIQLNHKARIAAFLVLNGSFSEQKCWISCGTQGLYVMYPGLMTKGTKGAAQWALAAEMSALIKAGKKSNLMKFLDNCSVQHNSKNDKFLFAKGYTLQGDRDDALLMKKDIDIIIAQMVSNKGKGSSQSFSGTLSSF